MENNMKCLAIGLQDTGKTSYITAFWAIEKDGNTKHKLTFDKYPSDTSYLDSMANCGWTKRLYNAAKSILPT